MQDNELNHQNISNSLLTQLTKKVMEVAERDSIIIEQQQEIELYKKKVEKLEGEKEESTEGE